MNPVIIGTATLYLGDCEMVMPTLGQVDAIVTAPPRLFSGCNDVIQSEEKARHILSKAALLWPSAAVVNYFRTPFFVVDAEMRNNPQWQTIIDPFMGMGRTAEAALAMGRSFIGIEIDSARFQAACDLLRAKQQGFKHG
jgi:predicted methyltransferase